MNFINIDYLHVTNVKWEKMSHDAAKKLEELVRPFACQKKSMFGYDVYWVNGNMFTGIFQSSIFFRLFLSQRIDKVEEEQK